MSSRVSKANLIILPHEYVKAAWVFFDTCFLQDKNNFWKILLKLCSFPLPTAFTFLVSNDGLIYSELSDPTSPPLHPPLPPPHNQREHIGSLARTYRIQSQRLSTPYSEIVSEQEVCAWVICLFPQVSHSGGWNSLTIHVISWLLLYEVKGSSGKYLGEAAWLQ